MVRTVEEAIKREMTDPEYLKLYGASDAKAEIAVLLAEVRRLAGKSQEELAALMGFSQPYVSKLEGGEANPTVGMIGSMLAMIGYKLVARAEKLLPGERRDDEIAQGYEAMAKENKEFAAAALEIAHEVVPEWE